MSSDDTLLFVSLQVPNSDCIIPSSGDTKFFSWMNQHTIQGTIIWADSGNIDKSLVPQLDYSIPSTSDNVGMSDR